MALRQRYSELVRRYHPDRNGGDRSLEAKLGAVIAAYQTLKGARALPDRHWRGEGEFDADGDVAGVDAGVEGRRRRGAAGRRRGAAIASSAMRPSGIG